MFPVKGDKKTVFDNKCLFENVYMIKRLYNQNN